MERFIWCEKCSRPTVHVIAYAGTHKNTHVSFCASCIICSGDKTVTVTNHIVAIADWNALVSRIIYDHV